MARHQYRTGQPPLTTEDGGWRGGFSQPPMTILGISISPTLEDFTSADRSPSRQPLIFPPSSSHLLDKFHSLVTHHHAEGSTRS